MTAGNPIVILGGRSFVAPYLMGRLKEAGLQADVVSRTKADLPQGFRSVAADIAMAKSWEAPEGAHVISLVPLDVLASNLSRFAKAQSIVALGSAQRLSEANRNNPADRAASENLEMAENILKPWCRKNGKVFTVLRPAMIYDGKNDRNVSCIARLVRRLGLFPLAAPGMGRLQPIHADDVAKAIVASLGNVSVYNKTLNIAGGEVLTYRTMIEAVFRAAGKQPRVLPLPPALVQAFFRLASLFGPSGDKASGLALFKHMNDDFVYDTEEALRLLNYEPRRFDPEGRQSA